MSSQITLKEIGRACGVSHITVSRALRGEDSVRPETAERIRTYAKKIGYKPNSVARMLAARRTGDFHLATTSSIILPYNRDPLPHEESLLFWDYVRGAVDAASQTQSSIEVLGFSGGTQEFDFIRSLVEEERVAGVLDLGLRPQTMAFLASKNVPAVSRLQSVRDISNCRNAAVYPDHIQGYILAWNYLAGKGHSRVGYLLQQGDEVHLDECIAASHLCFSGPKIERTIKVPRHPSSEVVAEALLNELGPQPKGNWPSVLFCSNDDLAHSAIVGLSERGFMVPRDLSLFGFDDSKAAEFCNPPICTIRNPRREIGSAMLNLLKDIIAARPGSRTRVEVLPMQLMQRKSVASV